MRKEKRNTIRKPKPQTMRQTTAAAALSLALGVVLGLFSKWLDNLGLEDTVALHRWIERLDLGNFFSDLAIWLLLALVIAILSASALRAALNVFVFFAGMCSAYHLYTILFSGFNPSSYMMIWYGITLLSPLLAALCWYAGGSGASAIALDTGIIAVFTLACFSVGILYIDGRGILYFLTYAAMLLILYRSPKQMLISLPAGILLAFLLSPHWRF